LIVGTNGSGKTVTMLRMMKHYLKNNKKIIFLDMKGSVGLIKEISTLCQKEKRQFRFFTPFVERHDERQIAYDPFKNKSANDIISMLLEKKAFSSTLDNSPTDSSYYRNMEKSFLE
jgi:ABC-type cobalamin/Fe3+-siderophores transport system ATPase subunit